MHIHFQSFSLLLKLVSLQKLTSNQFATVDHFYQKASYTKRYNQLLIFPQLIVQNDIPLDNLGVPCKIVAHPPSKKRCDFAVIHIRIIAMIFVRILSYSPSINTLSSYNN